uniref:SCAN box domain-containing protein n=1 Tax=Pseudonaja textilis TaxID=8673 RepID=A0A670Z5R9_PSETE
MEAPGSPLQAGSGLPEGPRSSEAERWRFRNCVSREAEGPRALCSRLHRLCRGWLRPERSSKAEMLDLVVLEQLLALLPPELSGWLRECGAESCAQAVALAEGCLLGPAAAPEPGKGRQVRILQNPISLPTPLTCFPAPFSYAGQPKETQPISWDLGEVGFVGSPNYSKFPLRVVQNWSEPNEYQL